MDSSECLKNSDRLFTKLAENVAAAFCREHNEAFAIKAMDDSAAEVSRFFESVGHGYSDHDRDGIKDLAGIGIVLVMIGKLLINPDVIQSLTNQLNTETLLEAMNAARRMANQASPSAN